MCAADPHFQPTLSLACQAMAPLLDRAHGRARKQAAANGAIGRARGGHAQGGGASEAQLMGALWSEVTRELPYCTLLPSGKAASRVVC